MRPCRKGSHWLSFAFTSTLDSNRNRHASKEAQWSGDLPLREQKSDCVQNETKAAPTTSIAGAGTGVFLFEFCVYVRDRWPAAGKGVFCLLAANGSAVLPPTATHEHRPTKCLLEAFEMALRCGSSHDDAVPIPYLGRRRHLLCALAACSSAGYARLSGAAALAPS